MGLKTGAFNNLTEIKISVDQIALAANDGNTSGELLVYDSGSYSLTSDPATITNVYSDRLLGVDYNSDGSLIATGDRDGNFVVFNTGDYSEATNQDIANIYDLEWAPNNSFIAVTNAANGMDIIDPSDWSITQQLHKSVFRCESVAVNSDSSYAAFIDLNGDVWVYNTSDWTQATKFSAGTEISSNGAQEVEMNQGYIVIPNDSSQVDVFNLDTWTSDSTFNLPNGNHASDAHIPKDGNYAYITDFVECVVYDTSDWSQVTTLSGSTSVKADPVRGKVAVGKSSNNDSDAQIYDIGDWTNTHSLDDPVSTVYSAAWA